MEISDRRVPRYEHHVSADEPSIHKTWSDLKARTGLSGTPISPDAQGWRGTLLGRNRYQVAIDTDVISVEVSGRSGPARQVVLITEAFDGRGLVEVVEAIRQSETPPASDVSIADDAAEGAMP